MDKKKDSNTYEIIARLKIKVVLQSVLVGAIGGFLVSIYRLIAKVLGGYVEQGYSFMRINKGYIILGILFLGIMGYIVGNMVQNNSMISGSGIPQIEGYLKGYFNVKNPCKILINKFIGGSIAILSGLSLGIEGPSIQISATAANVYGNLSKKKDLEKKFLISAASGGGLAAAFNAPFAGVMFTLEEVNKSFSPILFVSAIASCITADLVTWIFFGQEPILKVKNILDLPAKGYLLLVLFGIVLGVLGVFYNSTLLKTISLYKKIKIKEKFRVAIPFLLTIIFAMMIPEVLGGGENLINSILNNNPILMASITLLIFKFIYSMISFGADTPGGILFPLLTLGALVGCIFGKLFLGVIGLDNSYIINFILLGMGGLFASIVRAPITGLALVCEMSGSFHQLGPIALVCGLAYLVADLMGSEPIYDSLLKLRVASQKGNEEVRDNEKVIISYIVDLGAPIVKTHIKDINLGKDALVVGITTEGEEIIPHGNTIIRAGDKITVMVNEFDEGNVRNKLEKLCKVY